MQFFSFQRERVALYDAHFPEGIECLRQVVEHGTVAVHHHAGMGQHHVSAQALCPRHFPFVEAEVVSVFQHDAFVLG